jgi:hypothetical protein
MRMSNCSGSVKLLMQKCRPSTRTSRGSSQQNSNLKQVSPDSVDVSITSTWLDTKSGNLRLVSFADKLEFRISENIYIGKSGIGDLHVSGANHNLIRVKPYLLNVEVGGDISDSLYSPQ